MKVLHKKIGLAVQDLLYLLEREYPKKPAIELVGNRYRLSSEERMILFRGVFIRSTCENRTRKRSRSHGFTPQCCVIDCYNVFITIESYLSGRLVDSAEAADAYLVAVLKLAGRHELAVDERSVERVKVL